MAVTEIFLVREKRKDNLYKKEDLVKNIDKVINQYGNTFYKLDPNLRTDYFVSLVRQRVFEYPWSEKSGIALISFGLVNDSKFNCEQFLAKLTENQKKEFNSKIDNLRKEGNGT